MCPTNKTMAKARKAKTSVQSKAMADSMASNRKTMDKKNNGTILNKPYSSDKISFNTTIQHSFSRIKFPSLYHSLKVISRPP